MGNKLLKNRNITGTLVTLYLLLLVGLFTIRLSEKATLRFSRDRISGIMSQSLRRQAILTRMRKGSDYVQVNLLHLLLFKDDSNKAGIEKKIREEVKKNDENLRVYQKLIIDQKEQRLFNDLKATRVLYAKDREVLIQLIMKDNYQGSRGFTEHFLLSSFEKFQQANSNLSDYVAKRNNGDIEETQNIYLANDRTSQWFSIGLIAVLAIIGVMIRGVIIKSKATNILLTESEEKYRTLVEESSEIISSANNTGRYIFFNRAFQNKLEYSEEEILNMHIDDVLAEESKMQHMFTPPKKEQGHVLTGVRKTLQSKTGKKIIVEGNILLNYKNDIFDSSMAFFNDVTNKILAEQALAVSESRYRKLFNLSPLPTWLIDPVTARFTQINQAALEKYGYSEEEFLGMTILDIIQVEVPTQDNVTVKKQTTLDLVCNGNFLHNKKSGEIMNVQTYCV